MSQRFVFRRSVPRRFVSRRPFPRRASGDDASARLRRGGAAGILAAASLWGTTGTVQSYADGSTPFSVAAVRIVVGGLALLAAAVAVRRGEGLRRLVAARRNRPLIALGGAAVAAYQTAFFAAADRTGVATGTIVTIGSAPVFAGLIGLVTRRGSLTGRWAAGTCAAVTGCVLLVGGGARDTGADPAGIALALAAGLSYAAYATAASVLIARGEDDRAVAAALFTTAAVLLAPVLPAGPARWLLTGRGALIALYLGVVTTGLGYLLFARGLRTTPATTATTLTLAEPAVAAVLGTVLLHERLDGVAAAGLGVLAAGLVVLVVPARPRKAPRKSRNHRITG